MNWFAGLANEISSLSLDDHTVTGRKIQHCVRALEDVEQFDVIDTNLSIKAFLKDTRDLLFQMVRAVNIKSEVRACVHLSLLTPLKFAPLPSHLPPPLLPLVFFFVV